MILLESFLWWEKEKTIPLWLGKGSVIGFDGWVLRKYGSAKFFIQQKLISHIAFCYSFLRNIIVERWKIIFCLKSHIFCLGNWKFVIWWKCCQSKFINPLCYIWRFTWRFHSEIMNNCLNINLYWFWNMFHAFLKTTINYKIGLFALLINDLFTKYLQTIVWKE